MTKFVRNLIVAMVFGLSLGLAGCENEEEPFDEAAEEVEEAAEETGEAMEETAEEIDEELEEAEDEPPL